MTAIVQRSAGGGEVSPFLYNRHDLSKFGTWLRTCRNFVPFRNGANANRPGWQYVAEVDDSTKRGRLIPFIFSSDADDCYALEFGDLYVRFHHAVQGLSGLFIGEQITESDQFPTAISQANPAVVSATGHGFTDGQEIRLASAFPASTGMPSIMNQNYKVIFIDANSFGLRRLDGSNVDTTSLGPHVDGFDTVGRIYEVATPYTEEEVFELKYAQSADVLFIAHHLHPVQELIRFGDTNWSIGDVLFEALIDPPQIFYAGGLAGGSQSYRWKATAIDKNTREESLPGGEAGRAITTTDNTNPVTVNTSAAHGYVTGDTIRISGVATMTQINDRDFTITVTSGTQFTLDGENGLGYTDGTGGSATRPYTRIDSVTPPSSTNVAQITLFTAVPAADRYALYRAQGGSEYAFVGYQKATPFTDSLTAPPDIGDSPPSPRNPFVGAGNYPSVVAIIQQRLFLSGSDNDPERVWASEIGRYRNFSLTFPLTDDGALNFIVGTGQVNYVRALLEIDAPVLFTDGAEFELGGVESRLLTPVSPNPRQHGANGIAKNLMPIALSRGALFVQAQSSIIRSFGFTIETDGYAGDEVTIFSSHLVDGHAIVDWCFQKTPHPVLWAVRDDGLLLSFTYYPEQEIMAWARHDTLGLVESVCAIPEGVQTGVWLVVNRQIGNRQVRMIERMTPRPFVKIADCVLMDASKSYDGRNQNGTPMVLTAGTTWDENDEVEIRCPGSFIFRDDHIGFEFQMFGKNEDGVNVIVRVLITDVDTTPMIPFAIGVPRAEIPTTMRDEGTADWQLATNRMEGLWHLEGEDVAAVGDGFVLASPNNPDDAILTVEDGAVEFEHYFGVIHVGLAYISDIETLDVDHAGGVTIADEGKLLRSLIITVESTRGLWVGPKPPADDAEHALVGLKPLRLREQKTYDEVPALVTKPIRKAILTEWNSHGRCFMRQVDPVPCTVTAIGREGVFPFGE